MLVAVRSSLLQNAIESDYVLGAVRLFIVASPLHLFFVGKERLQVNILKLAQSLSQVLVSPLAELHHLLYGLFWVRVRVHSWPAILLVSPVQKLRVVDGLHELKRVHDVELVEVQERHS